MIIVTALTQCLCESESDCKYAPLSLFYGMGRLLGGGELFGQCLPSVLTQLAGRLMTYTGVMVSKPISDGDSTSCALDISTLRG